MKISLKHQTTKHKNSPVCSVIEHNLQDKRYDLAIAEITGRYPETQRVVNMQCDELVYVFEGEGKVVVEEHEQQLSAGDALVIEAGEKFYWEGNMKLFLSCRPAWSMDQHQKVE